MTLSWNRCSGRGIGTYTAGRVGGKLSQEKQLVTVRGPASLGLKLHGILEPSWSKTGAWNVGELWANYTRYPYVERLANREVLDNAVRAALTAALTGNEHSAPTRAEEQGNRALEGPKERWSNRISEIQNEVISHLVGADAQVTITIEIQAEKRSGFTKSEMRTVDENAATLKFIESGFTERWRCRVVRSERRVLRREWRQKQ